MSRPVRPGPLLLAAALLGASLAPMVRAADPGASLASPVAATPPTGAPGPGPAAAEPLPAGLPPGAIIAFMPRPGADYADLDGLRRWLAGQGFALCDGRDGTPDLRDRTLFGTAELDRVGQRLGSREHDHRVRGETAAPVRRNRNTPTGREQLVQIPDDQHRHPIDLRSARAEHLPPMMTVMFIMKVRR